MTTASVTSRPIVATMMPAVNPSIPRSISRSAAVTSRRAKKSLPLRPSKLTVATSAPMNATCAGRSSSDVTTTIGGRRPSRRRPWTSRCSHGDIVAKTDV
ncbi:hypothetical protein LRS13_20700 [Svornostia abyssi]|uniref:Uncharacterized protein n=1 Tax=Svornostia abyssi TaxID=2898438 RepID=A0ABY5PEL6_9ACTN|nr:hypothetical protein LRS13_20700 [Parviterribacteraceae bacterium J379]